MKIVFLPKIDVSLGLKGSKHLVGGIINDPVFSQKRLSI
jgi:hypothetical protein